MRFGERVVDAFEHHVFERHLAGVAEARIGRDGVHQFSEIVLLVDRHEFVAQVVVRRVQGDREHGVGALAEFRDLGRDTGGGDSDAPAPDRDSVAVRDRVDRFGDVIQIVERLAHAHEDDIRQQAAFLGARPFVQRVAGDQHLLDDFLGGEIAHEGLRAGMAEGAVEGAADLAGDAERARLADIRDIDAFALDAGAEAGQPFLGAVAGDLVVGDLGAVEHVSFGQQAAKFLGNVGHHREIAGAEMVNPAAQLLGAHAGLFTIESE